MPVIRIHEAGGYTAFIRLQRPRPWLRAENCSHSYPTYADHDGERSVDQHSENLDLSYDVSDRSDLPEAESSRGTMLLIYCGREIGYFLRAASMAGDWTDEEPLLAKILPGRLLTQT